MPPTYTPGACMFGSIDFNSTDHERLLEGHRVWHSLIYQTIE